MKKRKIISITLASMLFMGSLVSSAQTSIVDSMEFQGKEDELSMKKVIEIIMKDNPTINKVQLDYEKTKIEDNRSREKISDASASHKDEPKNSAAYLQAIGINELNADYALKKAEGNIKSTTAKIKSEIENTYFVTLQAENEARIKLDKVELTNDIYNKTKRKYELGLVSKQEVNSSELDYIKAQNEYIEAVNTLKKSKIIINSKLGYDLMKNIRLTDTLTVKEYKIDSIAEAINNALKNRNEIALYEYKYKYEKALLTIEEAKSGNKSRTYKEQAIMCDIARKEMENCDKTIELEVRSNYIDILNRYERIRTTTKAVQLTKEQLRLKRLSYDKGMGLLTDVQKALIEYNQSEIDLSKTILEYNQTIIDFEDSISFGRTQI